MMSIENYSEVINACRFCFMCRHISTVGNVTNCESDTPRGRALILDTILKDNSALQTKDFISAIYRSCLSAVCRYHCVSNYDEAALILAAREDIVKTGCEPESVKTIADNIIKTGNPFGETSNYFDNIKEIDQAKPKADVLYYIAPYTAYQQPEIAEAMIKILKKANVDFTVLKDSNDTGKSLLTLGYREDAKKMGQQLAESINNTGCKTVLTSCPGSYDALKNDFKNMDCGLEPEIRVYHTSEYILSLINDKKISINKTQTVDTFYLDSDYLKRYNDVIDPPRRILKAIDGINLKEFGTNQEESYTAGEGAMTFNILQPEITAQLCEYIVELIDNIKTDQLVTCSPITKKALHSIENKDLKVLSIEEMIAMNI